MASSLQPFVERILICALGKKNERPKTLVLESGFALHVIPAKGSGDDIIIRFVRGEFETSASKIPATKGSRRIQAAAHELAKFVIETGNKELVVAIKQAATGKQLVPA